MKYKYLNLLIVLVFFLVWKPSKLFAQDKSRSLEELFDMYVPEGFKTQLEWDSIRENFINPPEESFKYDSLLKQSSHNYLLYPFWLGNEYRQLEGLETKIDVKRLGYFAYVLSPRIGKLNTSYSWTVKNAVDSKLFTDVSIDLVVYCRGRHETELLLQSDVSQLDCMETVYRNLYKRESNSNLRKADGVNFYFQELPFNMIPEFKEFIYRFSNYHTFDTIYSKQFEISVTLPADYVKLSSDFLDMKDYVDKIYYADYNEFGICEKEVEPLSEFKIKSIDFNKAYDRYQAYQYRSPVLWGFVRKQYDHPIEELTYYQLKLRETQYKYMIYPYWLGNLYESVNKEDFDSISSVAYMGYDIDPLTGNSKLKNAWSTKNIFDLNQIQNVKKDLLVYCRGGAATDIFLDSDTARVHCIKNIFSMCNRSEESFNKELLNPDGINIYFPDFSFNKKREFAQFIKSISIVNDSLVSKDSTQVRKKLELRLTFSKKWEYEEPYLSSVLQYADSVYFVDFDQFGLPMSDCDIFSKANNKTGLIQEIRNQFYLYRFTPFFDMKVDNTSVESIIEIGIRKNNWEVYLFIILLLILLLIFIPVVYITNCCLHELLQKNMIISLLIVLMLIIEIGLLSIFMIEEMSSEIVFFDTSGSTQFFLLLLPIIVAGIYPILSSLQKQTDLP